MKAFVAPLALVGARLVAAVAGAAAAGAPAAAVRSLRKPRCAGRTAPEDLVALGPQWVAGRHLRRPGRLPARAHQLTARRIARTRRRAPRIAPTRRRIPLAPGRRAPAARSSRRTACTSSRATGRSTRCSPSATARANRSKCSRSTLRRRRPAVTWLGCVIAPDPIGLNSVRGLPDGGFITTNWLSRGGAPDAMQRMQERRAQRRAVGVAHRERLAEGAGQRGRRRERPRALERRQDAVRGGVGQPVVLPLVARCGDRRRATRFRSASASTTFIGRATARCSPSVRRPALEGREDRSEHARGARARHGAGHPGVRRRHRASPKSATSSGWARSAGNRIAILPAP